jgi:diguanylate cyclase (GGDEF)-like protein
MTIRAKILAATLIVGLVLVTVIGTAIFMTRAAARDTARATTESETLAQLTQAVQRATSDTYSHLLTDNLAAHVAYEREISRIEDLYLAIVEDHRGTARSDPDKVLVERVGSRLTAFKTAAGAAMATSARGVAPTRRQMTALVEASDALENDLFTESALERAKTGSIIATTGRSLGTLELVLGGLGLGAMAIVVLVGYVVGRSIQRPVRALQGAADAFRVGDLDHKVDTKGADEVSDLARAFERMRDSLRLASERLSEENRRRAEAQSKLEDAMAGTSKMNAELEEQVRERQRADDDLENANTALNDKLHEVATVSQEMEILAEMGALLQSDVASEEAFAIVGRYGGAVMPGTSGALYAMANSRNMLDMKASWGGSAPSASDFGPSDCWALRLGRPYAPEEENVLTGCRHVDGDDTGDYVCIPLSAQGGFVGVLTVYDTSAGSAPGEPTRAARERTHRLAVTFAERVALALSNLKLRDTLREQSIRDPLTGLYNRRFMEDSVEREAARAKRNAHPISFVMLDIDHFKDYNDNAGHGAGDAVLAAMGRYIREVTRTDDVACRYGGEEFLLVWPTMDAVGAQRRAEEVRQGIKALSVREGDRILPGITVSVGVAVMDPRSEATADDTIRAADAALYRAKAGGRDRVITGDDLAAESLPTTRHRASDAA